MDINEMVAAADRIKRIAGKIQGLIAVKNLPNGQRRTRLYDLGSDVIDELEKALVAGIDSEILRYQSLLSEAAKEMAYPKVETEPSLN